MRARIGADARLRLPPETEWEYAARGGPQRPDGHQFRGSDDVAADEASKRSPEGRWPIAARFAAKLQR